MCSTWHINQVLVPFTAYKVHDSTWEVFCEFITLEGLWPGDVDMIEPLRVHGLRRASHYSLETEGLR